jgi:radical SAM superfamily enzyme
MVGLPNETFEDIKNTVEFINKHNIQGLKIHSTYVVEHTQLYQLYKEENYSPISLEYYLKCLCYIITHISPEVVIHRISGDAPKDILVAPNWNSHKKWIMNGFNKKMIDEDLWQGKYY